MSKDDFMFAKSFVSEHAPDFNVILFDGARQACVVGVDCIGVKINKDMKEPELMECICALQNRLNK